MKRLVASLAQPAPQWWQRRLELLWHSNTMPCSAPALLPQEEGFTTSWGVMEVDTSTIPHLFKSSLAGYAPFRSTEAPSVSAPHSYEGSDISNCESLAVGFHFILKIKKPNKYFLPLKNTNGQVVDIFSACKAGRPIVSITNSEKFEDKMPNSL